MIKISASVMCADFGHLEDDIRALEKGGVDRLHFDIADGHFVPNFILGPFIQESLKNRTNLLFETHLMIENPDRYIEQFVRAGSDIISVHLEACDHVHHTIQLIKEHGARAGIALSPATPVAAIEHILDKIDMVLIMTINPGLIKQKFIPEMLRKIEKLKEIIRQLGLALDIEVDGNINEQTIPQVVTAGANILVGGSSGLFLRNKDLSQAIKDFRGNLKE